MLSTVCPVQKTSNSTAASLPVLQCNRLRCFTYLHRCDSSSLPIFAMWLFLLFLAQEIARDWLIEFDPVDVFPQIALAAVFFSQKKCHGSHIDAEGVMF